ncbi:hypothetical protein CEXT_157021 [Caerostris extrusa]|uniref:Uncharacterized protein n=1 Tax=Caerostris extrusa TaxID=172846 RepID=A0AAV4NYN9_CAEEX|nr:hypothetical protein CEXT_157021 [Caerostris extrusa]
MVIGSFAVLTKSVSDLRKCHEPTCLASPKYHFGYSLQIHVSGALLGGYSGLIPFSSNAFCKNGKQPRLTSAMRPFRQALHTPVAT